MPKPRFNTMNSFAKYARRVRLAAHTQTGVVKSLEGFRQDPPGFFGCDKSERALAWLVNHNKVTIGRSLAAKIRLAERDRDGYM